MTVAALIKEARTAKNYSQKKLAGVIRRTPGFVTKLESGDTLPGYETCLALAVALELSADQLIAAVREEKAVSVLKRFSLPQNSVGGQQIHSETSLVEAMREGFGSLTAALREVVEALRDFKSQ